MGYDTRERDMPHSILDARPAGGCSETVAATGEDPVYVTIRSVAAHIVPGGSARETSEPLPYWLVNVPPSEWPAECPEYLRDLPAKSIRILSTPDAMYERQSWETLKEIISECTLRVVTLTLRGTVFSTFWNEPCDCAPSNDTEIRPVRLDLPQERIESTFCSASRAI